MIQVTPKIALDPAELHFAYVRSSGPGGQNVNKVASAVQLRFFPLRSPNLPPAIAKRLLGIAGRRVNAAGAIIIDARRQRTQEANRREAIARLVAWIQQAATPPRKRLRTRPTAASRARRLRDKRRRSQRKEERRRRPDDSS
jgi:ribosome-associated protein